MRQVLRRSELKVFAPKLVYDLQERQRERGEESKLREKEGERKREKEREFRTLGKINPSKLRLPSYDTIFRPL